MENLKEAIDIVTRELKPELENAGFKQKGTSRLFFLDCKWFIIETNLYLARTRGGNYNIILSGISFLWDVNIFGNPCAKQLPLPDPGIFPEAINLHSYRQHENPSFKFTDFSPETKVEALKWILNQKEQFLQTYKNPLYMLPFFHIHNDLVGSPNGYIIARIFNNKAEEKFHKEEIIRQLEEHNRNFSIYFLPSQKSSQNWFRAWETFCNKIISANDKDFFDEINYQINVNRKKLKLEINERYF